MIPILFSLCCEGLNNYSVFDVLFVQFMHALLLLFDAVTHELLLVLHHLVLELKSANF